MNINKINGELGSKMNKSWIIPVILSILFYLLFLFLYIQDVINELIFLLLLFIYLLMLFTGLIILLVVFRKNRVFNRNIAIATFIIFVLFCYEVPLIGYTTASHIAYGYLEPTEVLEGSNVYSIGIDEFQIVKGKSKHGVEEMLTKQHVDVLSVIDMKNKIIYGVKNRQILTWLHLRKENLTEDTKENVAVYLGQEDEWLQTFLNRPKIEGYSAGLSLALSGRFKQGDFNNQIPIAVTGGINEKGDVLKVGGLKEKIQITEKAGIPFMIVPSKNAKEVAAIQKELKANVEIFDVSHVDEAIQVINDLNENP